MGRTTPALSLVGTLVLAACIDPAPSLAPPNPAPSDAALASLTQSGPRYIVVLKPSAKRATDKAYALALRAGGVSGQVWDLALKGFVLAGVSDDALAILRSDPDVAYVEPDGVVRASTVRTLPIAGRPVTGWWGLDRMDQRGATLDNQYVYYYTGAGTHVYILDTGIRSTHNEFIGRIGNGGILCPITDGCTSAYIDADGHGTAMAGYAAGSSSGIATEATIHSVRLSATQTFQCSAVVSGVNWVLANLQRPAVINMSLSDVPGCFSIRDAIQGALDYGVPVVKAAGNQGVDAFNDRGNRADLSIVVGATQEDGSRRIGGGADSNFGSVLDVFAPGSSTQTAGNLSNDGWAFSGGTSGAAAYVSGVAALILQQLPYADPFLVQYIITESATAGVVANAGTGSPNRLIYSLHTYLGMSGPDVVVSDGNPYWDAQWSSSGVGGNGGWTAFTWEAQINGGAWQTVATSTPTYTRRIFVNDQYVMNLRLTAVSTGTGETKTKSLTVYVNAP